MDTNNTPASWAGRVSPSDPRSHVSQDNLTPSSMGPGPRACQPCAAAKAKCIFLSEDLSNNGKCRRCDRLHKDCVLQVPATRKKKIHKITRVAQLEEKLDGIVSLLKSAHPKDSEPPAESSSSGSNGPSPPNVLPYEQNRWPLTPPTTTPQSFEMDTRFQIPNLAVPSHQELFRNDPDSLLTLYRCYMTDQFPFVVIPMGVTAEDLSRTRPFVLRVILMVANVRDMQKAHMEEEIMEYLADHMIMKAEKSLDLLQGLLILIAWYHFHIHLARRLTTLMQLATALLIDLGLNSEHITSQKSDGSTLKAFPEDLPRSNPRTLEGKRAFLGMTYISSIVSVYVKHMDAIRFSKYTEDCCQSVEEHAQYPSDQILVQLIRLQHIAEQVQDALPHDVTDISPSSAAPVALCIKILQTKLHKLQGLLPIHLQHNAFLLMQYHSTLVFLNEMAMKVPVPTRHLALHTCLTSIQSFLSLLGSVRTEESFKFTYCYWTQLTHILIVLGKISCFECEDWDLRHVRDVLDLSIVLDGFIARFEITVATRGSSELYQRITPRFRQYKELFEKKRASVMKDDEIWQDRMQHMNSDQQDVALGDMMQLDEAFWQEIMGDWGNNWQ
ncbi:tRNA processing endoribonuclease [Phlyctema vagabunda]|uniref:tRNA processing endoribonuclease n=1 Tax=Phlyctema vagabunda TaxID=108571 RepID=A0ABR4PQ81_9HELO